MITTLMALTLLRSTFFVATRTMDSSHRRLSSRRYFEPSRRFWNGAIVADAAVAVVPSPSYRVRHRLFTWWWTRMPHQTVQIRQLQDNAVAVVHTQLFLNVNNIQSSCQVQYWSYFWKGKMKKEKVDLSRAFRSRMPPMPSRIAGQNERLKTNNERNRKLSVLFSWVPSRRSARRSIGKKGRKEENTRAYTRMYDALRTMTKLWLLDNRDSLAYTLLP